MSKQLLLSASISVLAMAVFALTGAPALADQSSSGSSLLAKVATACASSTLGDVLPLLTPGLQ